jgi:hypothetical protein
LRFEKAIYLAKVWFEEFAMFSDFITSYITIDSHPG